MLDLHISLNKTSVNKLLAIFPHPDDESFCTAGLFQLAQKNDIKTTLICLTKGERGTNSLGVGNLKKIRTKELELAAEVLGIDELLNWDFPDLNLKDTKKIWSEKLKRKIDKLNPDIIVTFDHSGITGHPDHIVVSTEVLHILKEMKKPPSLLWRIPDEQEKAFFRENSSLIFASKPTHILKYGFSETLNKIKAIYTHASQMKSFRFKIQILEWFLFDHKELYCKVDLNKKYTHKFVLKKQRLII
ncbi:hypothetical protein A2715_05920 [Candidatus Woesebacteria bacterium RIFCSPHIGHO2_01_FULL_39_32]|nr:MAG: hypothetical protein A2715_05920 [Candidatus Woesebacteria bacterium RIFCSPHIGHO2_01_FULL_39_32]OGM36834.1 MAG: hypothetical protein A3F01_00395 [Candidatus Woesebacteria bacterium RIFCSPHIGHO2_12_FULL_38_11]OGM65085.1 MAG: hypothetical protein A2893_05530 [Candidatus Woesebacteria bacterium RIFCSPLOWO2_01_FULL_39_25]